MTKIAFNQKEEFFFFAYVCIASLKTHANRPNTNSGKNHGIVSPNMFEPWGAKPLRMAEAT